MRNKYPGTCFRCGGHVKANEGHFERVSRINVKKYNIAYGTGQNWLTQHADCAIKYRCTDIHYLNNPDKSEVSDE